MADDGGAPPGPGVGAAELATSGVNSGNTGLMASVAPVPFAQDEMSFQHLTLATETSGVDALRYFVVAAQHTRSTKAPLVTFYYGDTGERALRIMFGGPILGRLFVKKGAPAHIVHYNLPRARGAGVVGQPMLAADSFNGVDTVLSLLTQDPLVSRGQIHCLVDVNEVGGRGTHRDAYVSDRVIWYELRFPDIGPGMRHAPLRAMNIQHVLSLFAHLPANALERALGLGPFAAPTVASRRRIAASFAAAEDDIRAKLFILVRNILGVTASSDMRAAIEEIKARMQTSTTRRGPASEVISLVESSSLSQFIIDLSAIVAVPGLAGFHIADMTMYAMWDVVIMMGAGMCMLDFTQNTYLHYLRRVGTEVARGGGAVKATILATIVQISPGWREADPPARPLTYDTVLNAATAQWNAQFANNNAPPVELDPFLTLFGVSANREFRATATSVAEGVCQFGRDYVMTGPSYRPIMEAVNMPAATVLDVFSFDGYPARMLKDVRDVARGSPLVFPDGQTTSRKHAVTYNPGVGFRLALPDNVSVQWEASYGDVLGMFASVTQDIIMSGIAGVVEFWLARMLDRGRSPQRGGLADGVLPGVQPQDAQPYITGVNHLLLNADGTFERHVGNMDFISGNGTVKRFIHGQQRHAAPAQSRFPNRPVTSMYEEGIIIWWRRGHSLRFREVQLGNDDGAVGAVDALSYSADAAQMFNDAPTWDIDVAAAPRDFFGVDVRELGSLGIRIEATMAAYNGRQVVGAAFSLADEPRPLVPDDGDWFFMHVSSAEIRSLTAFFDRVATEINPLIVVGPVLSRAMELYTDSYVERPVWQEQGLLNPRVLHVRPKAFKLRSFGTNEVVGHSYPEWTSDYVGLLFRKRESLLYGAAGTAASGAWQPVVDGDFTTRVQGTRNIGVIVQGAQ